MKELAVRVVIPVNLIVLLEEHARRRRTEISEVENWCEHKRSNLNTQHSYKDTSRPLGLSKMTSASWLLPTKLSPSSGQTGTSAVSPPPGVPGTWPAWSGLGPPAPHRDSPTEALMEARTPAACPGRSELTCLQRGPLFYGHHEGVSEDHSSGHTWPGA